MVQYAKPKDKPKRKGFKIDPSQTKDMRSFLDKIIENRKNKIREKRSAAKKRNFLLLYYRECLRYCAYRLIEQGREKPLTDKSNKMIGIMVDDAKSFKISDDMLTKVGVIAASMIHLHADEGVLEDNINKINKEVLKIEEALDKDAKSLYKKYTIQHSALK